MSATRPHYTRADLDTLKTFDRAQVLAALGSFEDTGLDRPAFVLAAAHLLVPERVPGLARALERRDAEAAEAALRAWGTAALLRAGQVEPVELLRILKSLHEQLAYLEIVTAGHAGNWPTIGCRGMLDTLAALPLLAEETRFAEHALSTLDQQVAEQVLPDGVQDELTPHYHACVVDNIASAAESAGRLGLRLEARTLETLRRMVHYQQQTVVPDGSAQVAFNDSDPQAVPQVEERLRAVGLADAIEPPGALGPERFPYAGVSLLRQRASDGDLYLAFDGGPYGRSHQHEDCLGFWLFAHGRSLLVDPGRHLYDWSAASYLQYLRSSRAHSTVLVDGQGQHSQGRPETWIPRAPTPGSFAATDSEVRAAAAYDLGYGPDNRIAVTHRREIVLVAAGYEAISGGQRPAAASPHCAGSAATYWVLFDRLEGQGTHQVESRFQFAPGLLQLTGTRACTAFADANLLLEASGVWDELHVECGQEEPRGGWYSPAYGRLEPAPALSLSVRAELPLGYAVLLLPYRGPVAPAVRFAFDGVAAVVQQPAGTVVVRTMLGQGAP
ncbi:MAG: alginate lyase family protein [Candidatus Latescibacterota bacterium]